MVHKFSAWIYFFSHGFKIFKGMVLSINFVFSCDGRYFPTFFNVLFLDITVYIFEIHHVIKAVHFIKNNAYSFFMKI